jgi:hypothetical protein
MRLLVLITAGAAFGFQSADSLSVLHRTLEVTGFSKTNGKVLHWHDMQGVEQNYQSPAPFVTIPSLREAWFDPQADHSARPARNLLRDPDHEILS